MVLTASAMDQKGTSRMALTKWISPLLYLAIGLSVGYINYLHVSTIFEKNKHFSHLSALEREMALPTEMGFYYSYYKTVVEEQPFLVAVSKISRDRLVEYPKEVNAFNRFNIQAEVIIGLIYRYFQPWLMREHRECHIVDRGPELTAVESCVGLGEPILFYLEAIWILAAVTVMVLFYYACSLSGTLLGGVVAVAQYLGNHAHCTRVQWAPNERENLAQPALLLQMALVTAQLRAAPDRRSGLGLQVAIFLTNCICLLFWQLSQFVFLTQIAIFFIMEQLHIIDLKSFCIFLHAHFCGIHMAILLMQGNDLLKTSLYTSFFLSLALYCLLLSSWRIQVRNRFDFFFESVLMIMRVGTILSAAFWLKLVLSDFFGVREDSHIYDILVSKFTNFKSFHTLMYTCSAVFDFLPMSTFVEITKTGLLPLVGVAMSNVMYYWLFNALHKTLKRSNVKNDVRKEDNKRKRKEKAQKSKKDIENDEDSGIENTEVSCAKTKKDEFEKSVDVDEDVGIKVAEEKKDKVEEKYKNTNNDGTDELKQEKSDAKKFKQETNTKKDKNTSQSKEAKNDWVLFLRNLEIDPGIFYNMVQMCVFGFLAIIIMRLKLLFVPHLCLIASLAANPKYYSRAWKKSKMAASIILVPCVGIAVYFMYMNLQHEHSHIGEFSNAELEELVSWAAWGASAGEAAVFAAPLPLSAALLLSARTPVVAHPHYEHEDARQRAYNVYKAYGKFSSHELYSELTKLRVTYMVLDKRYCYSKTSRNCSMEEIWDIEAPSLRERPRLCHRLLTERVDHFYRVFDNAHYSVFKIHDYSVEYMPRIYAT